MLLSLRAVHQRIVNSSTGGQNAVQHTHSGTVGAYVHDNGTVDQCIKLPAAQVDPSAVR